MWTEFVSADGLVRATPEGKEKLKKDLLFTKEQHPIVAQLFSSTPEHMYEAAKLCLDMGFDGVDINMGCPDKSIEKQKCGAAMIKYPELAIKVIEAAKKAADGKMTVSVKTRVGYLKPELETWIPVLLDAELDLITIHARTRKDMSKVPANWDYVKQVVDMRNEWAKNNPAKITPLIFGNGDIETVKDGYDRAKETGADGIMIGRAMFGNPWFFRDMENPDNIKEVTREERITALIRQTELFDQYLGTTKSFAIMKKFFKTYMSDFEDAPEMRKAIMEMGSAGEVIEFLRSKI